MKKGLFVLLCLLCVAGLQAKEKKTGANASVDERVELLSVVSRLAGYNEYSRDDAKAYVADIEKWFEPYKEDTLVRYARYLREKLGMGYDAVARMAVSLQGKGGKYRLPQDEANLFDLYEGKDNTGRWNQWNAPKFVGLLNDFYKKTHFDKFFAEHKAWYKKMTDRFDSQVKFNRDWYAEFYGEAGEGDFRVVLGCSNGGSNYGPRVFSKDGKKTAYAIMGCWAFGEDGLPDFEKGGHASVLIHEFNHSFVNPLFEMDGNRARTEAAGKKIFAALKDEMSGQAYGTWPPMINESIVRAAVVRYLRDNGTPEEAQAQIVQERGRYFLWTEGLDSLLGVYVANRDKYPTLRSFYPKIVEFFDAVAANIDGMKADYLALCPKVVAVEPGVNGKQDVDPSITELKIVFDRPILVNVRNAAGLMGIEGLEHPSSGRKQRGGDIGEESNAIVYSVKLEPDTRYGFTVIGFAPATKEGGYKIVPYRVEFKTRK